MFQMLGQKAPSNRHPQRPVRGEGGSAEQPDLGHYEHDGQQAEDERVAQEPHGFWRVMLRHSVAGDCSFHCKSAFARLAHSGTPLTNNGVGGPQMSEDGPPTSERASLAGKVGGPIHSRRSLCRDRAAMPAPPAGG